PAESEPREVLALVKAHAPLMVLDNAESVKAGETRRATYAALVVELSRAGAQVLLTSRVEWPEIKPPRFNHAPGELALVDAAQAVVDISASIGLATLENRKTEIAEAARRHPKLIEWAVGQLERGGVDKVLADLRALRSRDV